ncbi:IstB ATP binding domain-containing protein [Rhizobium sp. Pop5]|nr:IstB ATP binding domain-containing protein [Rhizobium sp. Pop5]
MMLAVEHQLQGRNCNMIKRNLRQLKMHGMAQAVSELTEQGSPAFEAAIPILSQLLKAETAEREVRSTAYQLKTARFPAYRDLNGFDFTSSEINEALVRQLHRCDFLGNSNNIVLVGGPGTGKTHIATAIGVQAIEHHHKRVRFFSTVELVNALEQEKAQGRSGQIANRLVHSDLVILDELGYLPFSASGGAMSIGGHASQSPWWGNDRGRKPFRKRFPVSPAAGGRRQAPHGRSRP